jgi:hypothetical protein
MSKKSPASRFAEVFLSMGIPAIGYLRIFSKINWESLAWQVPVMLLAAWHVIIINDSSFGPNTCIRRSFLSKRNITGALLFPLFILPSLYVSPLFGIFVFLTMINWDIYSLKGKRHWLSGLFHNFIGGALHFSIGIACAENSEMGVISIESFKAIVSCWPEIMFFAFAMTAGAMHHDSFDVKEDSEYGYTTGAVKFSPDKWWRLAIVPFFMSVAFLVFAQNDFRTSFMISSIAYFAVYTFVSFRKKPTTYLPFRSICRTVFIISAGIYLYLKFHH